MEYNTLESYITDKIGVPTRKRVCEYPPLKKIIIGNEIEDFDILRLSSEHQEEKITEEQIRRLVIEYYQNKKITIGLVINSKSEIIRNNEEIPRIGVNVTHYGRYASITVQEFIKEKEKLKNQINLEYTSLSE